MDNRARLAEQRFDTALVYVKTAQAVLAIGGMSLRSLDTTAMYCFETNKWRTMLQRLNVARVSASACVVENNIYIVCGGSDRDRGVSSLEKLPISALSNSEIQWELLMLSEKEVLRFSPIVCSYKSN